MTEQAADTTSCERDRPAFEITPEVVKATSAFLLDLTDSVSLAGMAEDVLRVALNAYRQAARATPPQAQ
ncbi:MAG TPA: hypothetical protein VG939_20665 [Caulobacteraceae bacterium]|nr:hypothetical protein [Caulobacteraceae bacterium]